MFGEAVDDGNTNSFPRENSRFPRASTSSTRPATRSDSVRRSFLVFSLLRRRSPATLPFFVVKMTDSNTNPALKFQRSVEELTSQNPHTDDPRSMQFNQMNTCSLRYAMFARCAKELGDDHTRCKCGKKHNERKREAEKRGEGRARGEEREREGDRKRTKNSGERSDGGGQGGTGRMASKA
ncbi:hypothetical protein TGRUB_306390 [Toxoplasma gondii RUB]|uniref:Uncharacterized protein n=1 Tax=Toxoplasma gondii RUB TaxID=935652 RepID=A0A086LRT7_TOXGO|nr:hypothetical protein TGRUB_306390 [Toxoplasma gondii RUB]